MRGGGRFQGEGEDALKKHDRAEVQRNEARKTGQPNGGGVLKGESKGIMKRGGSYGEKPLQSARGDFLLNASGPERGSGQKV